jgi:hypothetical protein
MLNPPTDTLDDPLTLKFPPTLMPPMLTLPDIPILGLGLGAGIGSLLKL